MAKLFDFESASPTDSWEEKARKIRTNMRLAKELTKAINESDSVQPVSELPIVPELSHNTSSSKEIMVEPTIDKELEVIYLAICKLRTQNVSLDDIIKKLKIIINPNNIRYTYLINRIKLRLYQEFLSYSKMYLDSETQEEAGEIKAIMDEFRLKMDGLDELAEMKEVEELIMGAKTDNNLFFLTSDNGDVIFYKRLLDEDVPPFYHSDVLNLLQLMKQGIFKQVKKVVSKPYFQVRHNFIRITFEKLSNGNYIIIDVFVKTTPTKKYQEMLSKRGKQYLQLKDYYLMNFQDADFIAKHNGYYKDIIALLEGKTVGGERTRCQQN